VDINNATSSELLEINGIGKAKAAKIIEYRELNQCFKSIDELSKIEGISKQLVDKNRDELSLGVCQATVVKSNFTPSAFKDVLLDPVNLVFVIFIFMLAVLDLKTKKDFKSQIVSVGVLGTFVGIFIGLQNFNPEDIINSVNDILLGLKTAFFTSIVGMSVATILSIIEKLKDKSESK
jgi:competence ComEA-like helix-hairpin-helix protein